MHGRQKASALADQLQNVYLRDKKASETVKAAILESLGLLVEASPEVQNEEMDTRCQLTGTFQIGHSVNDNVLS